MEKQMKEVVIVALEAKLGYEISITNDEWEYAKKDALNDIYTNKLCFYQDVRLDYYINTVVGILVAAKRKIA